MVNSWAGGLQDIAACMPACLHKLLLHVHTHLGVSDHLLACGTSVQVCKAMGLHNGSCNTARRLSYERKLALHLACTPKYPLGPWQWLQRHDCNTDHMPYFAQVVDFGEQSCHMVAAIDQVDCRSVEGAGNFSITQMIVMNTAPTCCYTRQCLR